MARYVATIETPRPRENVFEDLVDLSRAAEWDPGISSGERLDTGPVRVGSRFRIVANYAGKPTELVYEVTRIDPDRSVTYVAQTGTLRSEDTMTFADGSNGGAKVTYDADLTLRGPLKLADPVLGLAFGRAGDKARDGLRARLGGRVIDAGRR